MAVAGGVVHRSASGDDAGISDDEFEDPANVATSIADHEDLSNGGITQDVNRIIIHSASADTSADLSADMPENRLIKLKIILKHSRML